MAKMCELPNLDYFSFGNPYIGSVEPFRYRISPSGEAMTAEVYLDVCYEKAQVLDREEFPIDADGLARMAEWLTEKQRVYG